MFFLSSSESELFIPPELLSHIFSFCPSSTLAVVTRTNFASLELASSFLYRSVRLEGTDALRRFFGTPEEEEEEWVKPTASLSKQLDLLGIFKIPPTPLPDRISPFLSRSQTLHLTFLAVNYSDALSPLSRRRLPSNLPLPLKTLTVSLPPQPDYSPGIPPILHQPPNRLLTLVSPKHFTFLGRSPPIHRFHRARRAVPDVPYLDIAKFPWTNLERVVLTNAQLNYARIVDPNPERRGESVLPRRFELVLNLADAWIGWEDKLAGDLVWVIIEFSGEEEEEEESGVKVVVLVKSVEKKLGFEAMEKRMEIERAARLGVAAGAVDPKMKERLVVKVQEKGVEGLDWEVEDKTLVKLAR